MTLAAAPEFGPEAYSTREKGERSAADITALKGGKSVNLTLNWSKGPITAHLSSGSRSGGIGPARNSPWKNH